MKSVASVVSLAATLLLGTNSAHAATYGANVQPSYYNSGNVNFGWSLMNANSKIQTLRMEIEPGYESQAKTWIAQAKSNGKSLICTYHHWQDNGSDSASALTTAGNWWKSNYSSLSASGSFQVNLMNEWGSHSQTNNSYASAYNSAISLVRSVYSSNIVIDIPGWGQETVTATGAVKGSGGTKINDSNITLSAHIYPGAWNQGAGHTLNYSDLSTMSGSSGRACMLGEFGTGSGAADWSGMVSSCVSAGWSAIGWAWNGDGADLNMCSPSWASSPTATSFSKSSYFSTIYDKLGTSSGGGGGGTTYPVAVGTYKLKNRATGLMLDNLGSTTNGTGVAQWASGSSYNQRWTLSYTSDGYAKLTCLTGGKCLDSVAHTGNGSQVGQWSAGTSYNQQWTLQSLGNGYFKVINRTNGLCLDTGAQTGNGTIMQFWGSGSSTNQQWQFVTP